MKNIISFILIIVFLGVVGLSVYFIYRTTYSEEQIEISADAEANSPSAFSVVYEGEKIDNKKNYTFCRNDSHRFTIEFAEEKKDYSIKVIPNLRVGFTVNGTAKILDEDSDLTKCFEIDKHADYFVLTLEENENLKTVLSKYYPSENVKISSTYRNSTMSFYRIIITVDGVEGYYIINFGIAEGVSEINILPTEIIF
ncbi:MAG: hypothetical protein IJR66_02315 [Clostridia bacterium]|nr:hypothetical protein [Clostridia bacterium]MBQ9513802.1 hypothetical protein [Clostridia bacterium]